jgi:nicotinamide-nucleotide amidase
MPGFRSAEIIAVGSELLTPHRSDTNSLFLTGRLNDLGIDVRSKAIVGDDRANLAALLRQALARADLVVITGGLGPTNDDVTREAVATALDRPLSENDELLAGLRARFASRGMTMPEINRRQAQVPRGAAPLPNSMGSAPGLWIDMAAGERGRAVVLLPGPPRELQPMFDQSVAPRLARESGGRRWRRRVVKLTGRAESQVDEVAQPVYGPFRDGEIPIDTTILAAPGQIELHLSAAGADLEAVDRALDEGVARLAAALVPHVFSVDGRSLEAVVGDLLQSKDLRIAVAESCTAGLVLARLTEVPGSSSWVVGGVVAYANEVKISALGVAPDLMALHGAVSEPVATAMADGVRVRFSADLGLSITGIAGPAGGSPEKPVGTVVIAIATGRAGSSVRTFRFPGDRRMVRQQATSAALDLVRRTLLASN